MAVPIWHIPAGLVTACACVATYSGLVGLVSMRLVRALADNDIASTAPRPTGTIDPF